MSVAFPIIKAILDLCKNDKLETAFYNKRKKLFIKEKIKMFSKISWFGNVIIAIIYYIVGDFYFMEVKNG